ncbi:hypothetical protein Taro_020184 [Colocasia esculenta]|uniref:Uncharacterized protein n=1 Tax=Colocasia esculenta TaxID=4460 RepID=A0A843UN09_COLES|nr:hypothetical protein [Colocasia esculenta]
MFSGSSASLDYAKRWRCQQTKSTYHGDRKSCSTRLEISIPVKELCITFRPGSGIGYVTTIRNRHSETVDRALVSRNSISGPKFRHGASASLDYANRWRSQQTESAYHSDWKSCLTWLEISTSGRRYRCTNIADIVTPSGLFPPLQ